MPKLIIFTPEPGSADMRCNCSESKEKLENL